MPIFSNIPGDIVIATYLTSEYVFKLSKYKYMYIHNTFEAFKVRLPPEYQEKILESNEKYHLLAPITKEEFNILCKYVVFMNECSGKKLVTGPFPYI
jgi:hypothetical protein